MNQILKIYNWILEKREWVRTQFHGKLYYLTFNKEQIELCNKAEDMNSAIVIIKNYLESADSAELLNEDIIKRIEAILIQNELI